MKSILLVRHAKSSWANAGQPDYDRPLNDRGLHDAPMMAARMVARKIKPDALVSSTANRAFTTATFFASAFQFKVQDIIKKQQLYHAPPEVFRQVISQLNNDFNTVALFAHNPGITEFANEMEVARIDNMPTCSVFGVHSLCNSWQQFFEAEKRFWLFDYPKNF